MQCRVCRVEMRIEKKRETEDKKTERLWVCPVCKGQKTAVQEKDGRA